MIIVFQFYAITIGKPRLACGGPSSLQFCQS